MYPNNGHTAAAVASAEERPQWYSQLVTQASEGRFRLIVVSQLNEDLLSLLDILRRTSWAIYWSQNCADAIAMLRDKTVPVVLCERDLPDGSWQRLLARVNSLSEQPRFIVTAHVADECLWAEALNLGAYDVLAKPFDAAEVVRVISFACRSWDKERAGKKVNKKIATGA